MFGVAAIVPFEGLAEQGKDMIASHHGSNTPARWQRTSTLRSG